MCTNSFAMGQKDLLTIRSLLQGKIISFCITSKTNLECKAGELVLLDVAAEYANYNSDLTRTIPVSGKIHPRQKEVYNAVLYIQREAMKILRPTVVYFDYQKESKINGSRTAQLKLISDTDIRNQNPENPAFRKYFIMAHHTCSALTFMM